MLGRVGLASQGKKTKNFLSIDRSLGTITQLTLISGISLITLVVHVIIAGFSNYVQTTEFTMSYKS